MAARPGRWGDAGVYSLYATKTISTGEGGVLVSRRPEMLEHARAFRNYGKPTYEVQGLNFRMSEFTAALGLVQIERMPEIVEWKNDVAREHLDPQYPSRLELPEGMTSGLYKYVVFDWLERSTGRVYDEPCHRILGHDVELPNSDWVASNHSCVPLYYRPEAHRIVRVLVTGGSGFIGSHVVDKLRARGHEPVIYDLRPSPWHEPGTVDTVLGSITDREALERALHSCDAVAHLAAVADVNDVHASPEDAERVNARGTVTVLEAARRAGVKRIVYASTIWVYSDCEAEAVDEETLLPAPSHLYTSTKLAGELYCKAYQELYGIDFTILRFGIPYGPRAREAAVIPAFVNKAFAGEALTLAGDGLQSRRFVYVEDLAEGVALGCSDVATNRVYNLASDENVTIKQIAETVQELIGNIEIVYTPARPGDFGGKIVCSKRAEQELGWTAATPFSRGVGKYVDWRREQMSLTASRESAEMIPAGEPDAESRPRQVLIISADIGEGHDLPARAVAREFADEDPDAHVSIVNGLPAMGPVLTKVLRENSAFMFRWVPWWFDFQYRLFMNFAPTRWLAKRLLTGLGRRGLMRLIRSHDPDLIVSTYPGVTAVLGELRRKGKLDVPCYSSITDLAGLQFWAHPGIDRHFITHPESIEEVEKIAGPGSGIWAKPPTSPAFLAARSRADARRSLGLPAEGTVIAVSGGGWGVGDLAGATGAALSVPDATVLCLCGRNDRLRARVAQRFGHEPRLRVMGFTDRMGDVLAASDALIHSSAGLTVLEAIIRGCPVISYGFGYGHVRASNAALNGSVSPRSRAPRRSCGRCSTGRWSTGPNPTARSRDVRRPPR